MKNFRHSTTILLVFSLLLSGASLSAGTDKPMVGVKIYECNIDPVQLIRQWHTLGINCAFVGLPLAQDKTFIKTLKERKITTFIIVPIFCSLDKPVDPPDLYAVTGHDKRAQVEWVHFICPTRSDYRDKKIDQIGQLIHTLQPDGISIDFIRYFVYWEKVIPNHKLDLLDNTCFCDHCLKTFAHDMTLVYPSKIKSRKNISQWILKNQKDRFVDWKCKTISAMVADIVRTAKKINPYIKTNAHIIPWRTKDYNNGIRLIAGQDIKTISKYVDFLSPMCYHHMVKQKPAWIHSVVKDMAQQTTKKILPSIQVKEAYLTDKLTPTAFRQAVSAALKKPSSGVIFWNWKSLQKERSKIKVLREYRPTNQVR